MNEELKRITIEVNADGEGFDVKHQLHKKGDERSEHFETADEVLTCVGKLLGAVSEDEADEDEENKDEE